MKLFSVYDAKAASFSNPFVEATDESAKRVFQRAVNDPQTDVAFAPEDYTLFRIGTFDPDHGAVVPETAPLEIAWAQSLVNDPEARTEATETMVKRITEG